MKLLRFHNGMSAINNGQPMKGQPWLKVEVSVAFRVPCGFM
jgi:hypothetical protein